MDMPQNTQNQCQKHNSPYVAVNMSPQCEKECRFLCVKCLLDTNEKQTIKSIDEANIYLSDLKKAFLQTKQDQNKKNLEVLKELQSSIQSLKVFYVSTFETIIAYLKGQEQLISKEQEELNIRLEKVDLNNFFSQTFELSLIEYEQIKELTKSQIQNLEQQEKLNHCLKQLQLIDESKVTLTPDSDPSLIQKKQVQRTPHLKIACETHKKEIIYFDLNEQSKQENKILCALCASNKLVPFTDLQTAQKQWQELETKKAQLLSSHLEKGKKQIETAQSQLKDTLIKFEKKIHEVNIKLESSLASIQDRNQVEMNKMNQDWLGLQREDILQIAETLSQPSPFDILIKELKVDCDKDNKLFISLIEDSIIFFIETLSLCNKSMRSIYQVETQLQVKDEKQLIQMIEKLNGQITQMQQQYEISKKTSTNLITSLNKSLKDEQENKNQVKITQERLLSTKNKEIEDLQNKFNEIKKLNLEIPRLTQETGQQKTIIKELKLKESLDQQLLEEKNKIVLQHQALIEELDNVDQPPNYEIVPEFSYKSANACQAIVFNSNQTIMIAGFTSSQIIVFEFNQGLNEKQILYQQTQQYPITALYFRTKENQFISGTYQDIGIWGYNNTNHQYFLIQTLKQAHQDQVQRVIMNKNEDLMITCSNDGTVKFWINKNQWQCSQTLKCLTCAQVNDICLNYSCTYLSLCGKNAGQILIYNQAKDQQWIRIQTITYSLSTPPIHGNRICFIGNNYLAFQQDKGEALKIYQFNKKLNIFVEFKSIPIQVGLFSYYAKSFEDKILFPMMFNSRKQVLLNKNSRIVSLIKKENTTFFVQQSIDFETDVVYGAMTNDFKYLVTWDDKSKEFQVRTQK